MLSRSLRVSMVVLLLIVGVGAGALVQDNRQRADALASARIEVLAGLDRISAALRAVGAAQEAYVVPGQTDQPWFERVSALMQQLYDEVAETGTSVRSVEAAGHMRSLTAGIDALVAIDIQVREHLRLEQELMAADVILGDGRTVVDSMVGEVLALADAERATFANAARLIEQSSITAVGVAAGLWLIGLVVLAWGVAPPAQAQAVIETPAAAAPEPAAESAQALDLDAVTGVAAAIAQVTSGDDLPAVFDRVPPALGASGLVLWMATGTELVPAMASGYSSRVLRQLPSLSRHEPNATVRAWTSGRVQAVAGDATTPGAVAAPLFGVTRCTGVLAAEVPGAMAATPAVRAAVALLAAQLSGIVSAWPESSASAADPGDMGPREATTGSF